MNGRYLIDTSVAARAHKPTVATVLDPLVERGLVETCPLLDVEFAYAATSEAHRQELMDERRLLFPWVPMSPTSWEQVAEIQRRLTAKGTHRGVGVADMAIAATAAHHGLTVLHYDHDFDLIAGVYDVPTEWVVPAGLAD